MLLLLVFGYATGGVVFYSAAAVLLVLLAADYARMWSMRLAVRKISVLRSLTGQSLQPGMSTTLTSRLKYHGALPVHLSISQPHGFSSSPDTGTPRLNLARGSVATVQASITLSKLGVFPIGPLRVIIESWLFGDMIAIPDRDMLSVTVKMGTSIVRPSTALRSNSNYSDIFENVSKRTGGSDFSGVRRYVAGDNVKNIDWAMSGRSGALVVRQYEEDHTSPVCFIIDVDKSMGTGEKTELDSAVGLVGMLTDRLRIDNEIVGLVCFSRKEIISYLPMGMSRDHVANMKNMLSTIKPVASSNVSVAQSLSAQELRYVGRVFDDDGVLSTVLGETFKGYMANVKQDGFSRAVLKVSQSTTMACHIVVITNLSMGLTSLLNGLRMASYYGHTVSVVLTPHVWHQEKELIDIGHYYEEYTALKDTIQKLKGISIKVIDLSSTEKPEDIIYASRIKSRLTGIRG